MKWMKKEEFNKLQTVNLFCFFLNKLIIYVNQSTIEFGQALFQLAVQIIYEKNVHEDTSLVANGIVKHHSHFKKLYLIFMI
jgi:hypothetical protein